MQMIFQFSSIVLSSKFNQLQLTGGRNKKKGSEYLAGMNLTIFQLSLEQLREGWGEVWKQSANNEESERNGG